MKANTRYTVSEIVNELGYDVAKTVGKMRVRVAGIPMNNADAIITIQPEAKELDVIIGNEKKTIKLEGAEDTIMQTDAVVAIKEKQGKEKTKQFEALKKVKKEKE